MGKITLVMGYTGAGKTLAAGMLAEIAGQKALDTFSVIRDRFASANGMTVEYVERNKSSLRMALKSYGTEMCASDAASLIKIAVSRGATIVAGCRRFAEVDAAKRELGAEVLWVHRPGITRGETDEIDVGQADSVVNNNGTPSDLRLNLARWYADRHATASTIETQSGTVVDVVRPLPESINLPDIAHSLALRCRWGGHCRRFYSIAEHSFYVMRLIAYKNAAPSVQLAGLMHDAAEAYVCDCPSPLKRVLAEFRELENRTRRAIATALVIPALAEQDSEIVKTADLEMLAQEASSLMHNGLRTGGVSAKPAGIYLSCWSPEEAEHRFIQAYYDLRGK